MAGTGWEWFDGLDPETKKALLVSLGNAGNTYFAGRQASAENDEQRRENAIVNKQTGLNQLLNSETSDYRYKTGRDDANAVAAGKMAGNSPLQFQSQRARMSALGDILGVNGSAPAGQADFSGLPAHIRDKMPNGGKPLGFTPFSSTTAAKFAPGAMAAAEGDYFNARSNIDPSLESPDLGAVGYGGAGTGVTNQLETQRATRLADQTAEDKAYNDRATARRTALEASLNEMGPDAAKNAQGGEDDDGGIDWKKWAGIGAGVGAGMFLGSRG
jgi:hypothetical protein